MERLIGNVQKLLDGSGACAAVIWARDPEAEAGSVILAEPAGIIPPGTAWPRIPHSEPFVVQHDPAMVASLVPTSLRLEMPAPPAAALSMPIADPDLSLLLVWCDSDTPDRLPEDLVRLLSEEMAYDVAILWGEQCAEQQALRLQTILDALSQGVVSVDHNRGVAEVNRAAATLLGLPSGQISAADFASAMHGLMARALNHSEVETLGGLLMGSPAARIECLLRFAETPRRLQVSSHGFTQGRSGGRVWVFDDVSALAEALESVELSNELQRASADSMLDPQVLFEAVRDAEGTVVDYRYLSVNRATARYLKIAEDDLIGKTVLDTSPNMLESGLMERYAHCLETGEPVILNDFAYFNEMLDDARRYDIRATRARPDLLTLTWSDVTERYEAARRIASSEERYRLLTQNASDAITHVRDGRFVWVSPSIQKVLGAPPEHWIGRHVRDIIPQEDADALVERLAILDDGGAIQRRFRVVAADGVRHWVHVHASPFLDSQGTRDGFTGSLRLVDDEVAAEREIEQARRDRARADLLFRRSIESAAVGMCLVSPEGGFVEVNHALCEFFGFDADVLKRKTWQELTAPEFLDEDQGRVDDMLAGRLDSYRLLKQYLHASGRRIWGDLSVSCIRDGDGRLEQFISQIIDVTATVEANERNVALNKRLTDDLQSAATYVASIMPSGLAGEVAITSRYLPSRELGGDCFDYTWIDDDHLLVYLIDVSGHGIEPALLAVSVQNMLRSGTLTTETLLDPAVVLTELNRLFQMELQSDHFFTIWYGVYHQPTRTLRYASAGAPPPYALDNTTADGLRATELTTPAAPVGAFEGTRFTTADITVPPGCRILIYSDGASEIPLPGGGQLSQDGFRALVTAMAARPDWTLDDLIDRLRGLTGRDTFTDDLSLIQLTF